MTFPSLQPSVWWIVHSVTQASGPSSSARTLLHMMKRVRESLACSGLINHREEMKWTKLTFKRESIASIRIVVSRMWHTLQLTVRTPIRCCGAQVQQTDLGVVKPQRKISPKCLHRGGQAGSSRATARRSNHPTPSTIRSQLLMWRKATTFPILPDNVIGAWWCTRA